MGDLLKAQPGCHSSSAGLAVREQDSVQVACHSDTHMWLSITLAPVGAVQDQAEPSRPPASHQGQNADDVKNSQASQ